MSYRCYLYYIIKYVPGKHCISSMRQAKSARRVNGGAAFKLKDYNKVNIKSRKEDGIKNSRATLPQ